MLNEIIEAEKNLDQSSAKEIKLLFTEWRKAALLFQ